MVELPVSFNVSNEAVTPERMPNVFDIMIGQMLFQRCRATGDLTWNDITSAEQRRWSTMARLIADAQSGESTITI